MRERRVFALLGFARDCSNLRHFQRRSARACVDRHRSPRLRERQHRRWPDPPDAAEPPDDMGDEPTADGDDNGPRRRAASRARRRRSATPIPSKIRYVMVLVKENHTFDNYFTGFPGAESTKTAKLSNGTMITRAAAPTVRSPRDISHSNSCGQKAYDNGKMDGFDLIVGGRTRLPFYYYTEPQIPNYWQYARNFVLADHFFSTTLGPSTPGHAVFWTAQSLVARQRRLHDGGGTGCGAAAGARRIRTSRSRRTTPRRARRRRRRRASTCRALVDHLPAGLHLDRLRRRARADGEVGRCASPDVRGALPQAGASCSPT